MFCWVEDRKNANSKNRFIVVHWLTMVLWMRLFKSTSWWRGGRGAKTCEETGDIFRAEQILLKLFIFLRHSLAWLIKMRKCQQCMLTLVGAEAWLNIMKSINSKCVMFLACLFSNWDYNCCVWVVFRFGPRITTNDKSHTVSLLMKQRSSEFYESWGRILYNEDWISQLIACWCQL